MKQLISVVALALACSTPAFAAAKKAEPAMVKTAASAPMTQQQSKMASCNADAGAKKGDERKAFMKECLSAQKTKMTPQERMKSCNTNAKGKKGDERKAYMKECLSK
jgi:hypothetical protein